MNTSTMYQYINLDYLNLMTDGDDEMKKVMIDMLFEELPQELEKMNVLELAGDSEELKSVSHKMKSTLAFIGNDNMTEANKQIEAILKSGEQTKKISDLLNILNEFHHKVIAELQLEYSKL